MKEKFVVEFVIDTEEFFDSDTGKLRDSFAEIENTDDYVTYLDSKGICRWRYRVPTYMLEWIIKERVKLD